MPYCEANNNFQSFSCADSFEEKFLTKEKVLEFVSFQPVAFNIINNGKRTKMKETAYFHVKEPDGLFRCVGIFSDISNKYFLIHRVFFDKKEQNMVVDDFLLKSCHSKSKIKDYLRKMDQIIESGCLWEENNQEAKNKAYFFWRRFENGIYGCEDWSFPLSNSDLEQQIDEIVDWGFQIKYKPVRMRCEAVISERLPKAYWPHVEHNFSSFSYAEEKLPQLWMLRKKSIAKLLAEGPERFSLASGDKSNINLELITRLQKIDEQQNLCSLGIYADEEKTTILLHKVFWNREKDFAIMLKTVDSTQEKIKENKESFPSITVDDYVITSEKDCRFILDLWEKLNQSLSCGIIFTNDPKRMTKEEWLVYERTDYAFFKFGWWNPKRNEILEEIIEETIKRCASFSHEETEARCECVYSENPEMVCSSFFKR